MFEPCTTNSCLGLSIKDDGVLEYLQENFKVHLAQSEELAANENLVSRIVFGVQDANVVIIDNDGNGYYVVVYDIVVKLFLFLSCCAESAEI